MHWHGDNRNWTIGRIKIKITLSGSLVYYFDVWVGNQSMQEAILGMDFMVPAGICLDLADGTLCLPDEFRSTWQDIDPLWCKSAHDQRQRSTHSDASRRIGGSHDQCESTQREIMGDARSTLGADCDVRIGEEKIFT